MKKALEVDLSDLAAILEEFVAKLNKMEVSDQIDLAARLKPAEKAIKKIDEHVKELVKKRRNNKPGSVLGIMFKAVLVEFPVKRLDQAALKDEDPEVYESYVKEKQEQRITFELR